MAAGRLCCSEPKRVEKLRTMSTNDAPLDTAVGPLLADKPFSFDPAVLPQPFPAPALFVTGRQDHLVNLPEAAQ
jgi:hypothetical protein